MSEQITEEELARFEALSNEAWQRTVDMYLKDFPSTEKECVKLYHLAKVMGLHFAVDVLTTAMMKLHNTVQHQTGKALQISDLSEEGVDNGN